MEFQTRIAVARKIIEDFPREICCKDPFRVLIGTVLSQRAKDEQTELAEKLLFERYSTPQALAQARESQIYPLIKNSGMYRQKAKRIIEIAQILMNDYQGIVPSHLDRLLCLPGVGRKTANIVLYVCFGIPALAVDTHVHRIANRLGWLQTKTPEQTEMRLKPLVPETLWGPLNGSMVNFGKAVCKPIKPLCQICAFSDPCPSSILQKKRP